ncbi:hypothetical protein D9611_009253 [Ephemerocybe angulata]|uniref:Uncharacterized protein n=1 Tax=Ephemerocybe angulata TaxID=980116 RepID=A0A8H5BGH3_9AGAR|nr:hypothetical protein D9611_009253 [Tulosesus angulatus]
MSSNRASYIQSLGSLDIPLPQPFRVDRVTPASSRGWQASSRFGHRSGGPNSAGAESAHAFPSSCAPPVQHPYSRPAPATIPLPFLTPGGACTIHHDLGADGTSPLVGGWDILKPPPASYRNGWKYVPATNPGTESVTIHAPFLRGRPLVVFGEDLGLRVTIEDVLQGVHDAAVLEVRRYQELLADFGAWMWAGLVPSATERDVWILQLH